MNLKNAVLKPSKPYSMYKGCGIWHDGMTILINNTYLIIKGMIVGCGVAQMSGNTSLCEDEDITKELLLEKLQPLKKDGVGAIVAVFGQNFLHYHQRMLDLGFEPLKTYNNYRHDKDGDYKQTLYIITL